MVAFTMTKTRDKAPKLVKCNTLSKEHLENHSIKRMYDIKWLGILYVIMYNYHLYKSKVTYTFEIPK